MALAEARVGNGQGGISANTMAVVLAIGVAGLVVVAIYLGKVRLVVETTLWIAPVIAALTVVAALFVRDRAQRGFIFQVLVFALIAGGLAYLIHNTLINLESRKIATGYGFLDQEARFEIGESLIAYTAASPYGRALMVGFLNTLKVSILGIVIATVVGIAVGILSLSKNWLVARLASVYVNFLRNVPVLLHIILWYTAITFLLPPIREAISPIAGVYLTQRGLYLPVPVDAPGWQWARWSVPIGAAIAWLFGRWARARQDRTGERLPTIWIGAAIVVGLPFLVWGRRPSSACRSSRDSTSRAATTSAPSSCRCWAVYRSTPPPTSPRSRVLASWPCRTARRRPAARSASPRRRSCAR
jgi:His/Glu/Gln/Arg/opine family amino acid ABC transporter permease subunit